MHSLQENEWVPAKVPGSVYQAYLDAGKMDDPFYRDNEEKALNLMKQDFEFATTFDAEENFRNADRTVLHFDVIDTLGEIYLNGIHLGDTVLWSPYDLLPGRGYPEPEYQCQRRTL